jgi:RNA recognition motif-containing protein
MKNIYVGNLDFQTTEDELRTAFEVYGAVSKVNIVTDRDTGQKRGFAFVEMANDSEGDKAIAGLSGATLGGRAIMVNEARPKRERSGGFGGNRGGGGGRGRY